jgi:hypothetical protein
MLANQKDGANLEGQFMPLQGHPIPANYNPAEFIADLISVDSSAPAAEEDSR